MKQVSAYLFFEVDDPFQLPVFLALNTREAATFAGSNSVKTFGSALAKHRHFKRRYMCERVSLEEMEE